ncbi:Protein Y73F8A.35 b, partial [Aphelenchoides avenae]
PFYVRIDSGTYKANKSVKEFVYKRSCREGWEYQLEYLQAFLDTYKSQPKWSLTWMNTATHDSSSGLYHLDGPFYKFLQDNKENVANSFLFILGDHGYRHGRIRETKQGEIEDNNPVAIVAVPERLRSNEQLMSNLQRNARQLVTHYDHFATFHSILNVRQNIYLASV